MFEIVAKLTKVLLYFLHLFLLLFPHSLLPLSLHPSPSSPFLILFLFHSLLPLYLFPTPPPFSPPPFSSPFLFHYLIFHSSCCFSFAFLPTSSSTLSSLLLCFALPFPLSFPACFLLHVEKFLCPFNDRISSKTKPSILRISSRYMML